MKKKILSLMVLVFGLVFAVGVSAAGPGPLTCFDGPSDSTIYGGNCTITAGTATLDNLGVDSDGSYSGVYYPNDTLKGMLLSGVNMLSFSYTGTPTAGSPRISLPVDTNNDGTAEFYAFISALYCNDGFGNVNPLTDSTCTIYVGSESFANWNALVLAHPTWKVADAATFVIADDAGTWTVSNVVIGESASSSTSPTNKNECKNGGWKTFTNPSFKNQGQCVSSTNH